MSNSKSPVHAHGMFERPSQLARTRGHADRILKAEAAVPFVFTMCSGFAREVVDPLLHLYSNLTFRDAREPRWAYPYPVQYLYRIKICHTYKGERLSNTGECSKTHVLMHKIENNFDT